MLKLIVTAYSTDDMDKVEELLGDAIEYTVLAKYLVECCDKAKKQAIHCKASTLIIKNREVYLQRKKRTVKVITSKDEQRQIVHACHSEATSGHVGVNKMLRQIAERFYFTGMTENMKNLVSR